MVHMSAYCGNKKEQFGKSSRGWKEDGVEHTNLKLSGRG